MGAATYEETKVPEKVAPSAVLIDLTAKICHEVNRAFCASIGDTSQKPWEEAPQWQRDSTFDQVAAHIRGELSPEQSHEQWSSNKLASGWTYGPVKDETKKEHPCLVPYSDLPQEQKTKDFLIVAVCRAALGGAA